MKSRRNFILIAGGIGSGRHLSTIEHLASTLGVSVAIITQRLEQLESKPKFTTEDFHELCEKAEFTQFGTQTPRKQSIDQRQQDRWRSQRHNFKKR